MPNPRKAIIPQTPGPEGIDYTKIHVCPICGTTELRAELIVTVTQDEQGSWKIEIPEEDSIDYAMSNPNNVVRCTNPLCGDIIDAEGNILPFKDSDQALAYFCAQREIILPELTEAALMEYDPDLAAEYEEWVNGFTHNAWEGTIGDCKILG